MERKSQESFSTEIMKQPRQFPYWTKENFLIIDVCESSSKVDCGGYSCNSIAHVSSNCIVFIME